MSAKNRMRDNIHKTYIRLNLSNSDTTETEQNRPFEQRVWANQVKQSQEISEKNTLRLASCPFYQAMRIQGINLLSSSL